MLRETLASFITSYIAARKTAKLEAFDKESAKKLAALASEDQISVLRQQLQQQRAELEQKYQPQAWLSDAASRAGQIKLVTHAAKFTHSDARGSSIFASSSVQHEMYLSTAALQKPALDVVGNAAILDVAKLLQTEVEGNSLIASLQRGDYSALESLTDNPELCASWVNGFKQVLVDRQPASHKLAKQIYFPIADGQYHLLSPLFSSALAHALNQRIISAKFSEEAKTARAALKAKSWHDGPVVAYPGTAITQFGGTKPQNISYLNSVRGGKVWLLPCAPPVWQTQSQPPSQHKSIFNFSNDFSRQSWPVIQRLKHFLRRVKTLDSTLDIRQQRLAMTDEIIDILFNYVAGLQNQTDLRGWSAHPDCVLKRSQQLWLDPWRSQDDAEFQFEREGGDWKNEVARDFGHWLSRHLHSDKLNMGETERRHFSTAPLFKQRLRELEKDLAEDLS
ncbi:type I-F CRISPR-associated protein Csy1 [Erwinia pyrifoliae]|uniref:Type I-F CRISPR-associated protein Csy1 n=1 Tax=Erwinia pyrifoliae TaxID=79967 RepID=A0ABY5X5N6_ERWPY|nr:type I-F CRISPR-associated protein Csy1 [Erwinia pyrifoliae]UWS32716.1 type I-F CRISPR-associated protein Csy1 [Erwinia pyrifoliae]